MTQKQIIKLKPKKKRTLHKMARYDFQGILPTALCLISGQNEKRKTLGRILFDTGASCSVISPEMVRVLNLNVMKVPETPISGTTGSGNATDCVYINLYERLGGTYVGSIFCLVLPGFDMIFPPVCIDPEMDYPDVIQEMDLADSFPRETHPIHCLIGQDSLWAFFTGKIYRPKSGPSQRGPIFTETVFGLVLQGSYPILRERFVCTSVSANVQLDYLRDYKTEVPEEEPCCTMDELKNMWSLEHIGISSREAYDNALSSDDRFALEHFDKHVRFDKDHYVVRLCFGPRSGTPASNYAKALSRLKSVEKMLLKDPKKMEGYKAAIDEYFSRGDAEVAPSFEREGRVYYLPHHAVIKEDRATTKVRVVFDASAKSANGLSLNDCLLRGPNSNDDLLRIILRFRRHNVPLVGDVAKMYLNIGIEEKDRDFLRFLWRDCDPKKEVQAYRMTKVTFGIRDSAHLATQALLRQAEKHRILYPDVYDVCTEDRWMDDVATGADSADDALNLVQRISEVMRPASFNFRKWMSSNADVISRVPEPDRADVQGVLKSDPTATSNLKKVLGVQWNIYDDTFRFGGFGSEVFPKDNVTKRDMASQIAKLFDPLGLISPYTITGKLLFQETWAAQHLDWDDTIGPAKKALWSDWTKQLLTLDDLSIPRAVTLPYVRKDASLIVFADSSLKAYCATVYLRVRYSGGLYSSRLVVAKSRVAPLKPKLTIPRLELVAALIAARLANYVQGIYGKEVPVTFFTDSTIALHWIKGEAGRWKSFVANRVDEIKRRTCPQSWRHCVSEDNPSDLGTRGIRVKNLLESDLWWRGPAWLTKTRSMWPSVPEPELDFVDKRNVREEVKKTPSDTEKDDKLGQEPQQAGAAAPKRPPRKAELLQLEGKNEAKAEVLYQNVPPAGPGASPLEEAVAAAALCVLRTSTPLPKPETDDDDSVSSDERYNEICDTLIKRFSNFLTLLRVTVFVMRVFTPSMRGKELFITSKNYEKAIFFLARRVQQQHFSDDIASLEKGREISSKSKLKCLHPFIGEGKLLRVGGRLSKSEFDYGLKHPIILPQSQFLKGLVLYVHEKFKHMGPEWTLYNLRRNFWITKGRRTVKSILSKCVVCQRHSKQPMQQKMAPLPTFRTDIKEKRPFLFVGVDYCGPIEVRPIYKQYVKVKKGHFEEIDDLQKSWVCLFTCAVTRAVHLELVSDSSTECFLLALRRFIARRGQPQMFVSDNGKNFRGASKELYSLYKAAENASRQLEKENFKWKFNAEKSPWWGGLFEAMVKIVKGALKKTLGQRRLTFEQLATVLTEVEQVVNSRPLGTVSDSVEDPLPITPQMLLLGYEPGRLPIAEEAKFSEETSEKEIGLAWKHRQMLASHFFERFKKDYLFRLHQTPKWNTIKEDLKEGEIVLIRQDKMSKRVWPLARVREVFKGRDGLVRSAEVKTVKGVLRRPVQELVRLEIADGAC